MHTGTPPDAEAVKSSGLPALICIAALQGLFFATGDWIFMQVH
jgi:hypothetical protein